MLSREATACRNVFASITPVSRVFERIWVCGEEGGGVGFT